MGTLNLTQQPLLWACFTSFVVKPRPLQYCMICKLPAHACHHMLCLQMSETCPRPPTLIPHLLLWTTSLLQQTCWASEMGRQKTLEGLWVHCWLA